MLVVSDGEPYYIDAFDSAYLHEDTRRAIAELQCAAVNCVCLALDAQRLDTATRTFALHRTVAVCEVSDWDKALCTLAAFIQR